MLHLLPLLLVPFQAATAQKLLLDQVELLTHHGQLIAVQLLCANGVPVQVDLFQFAQSREAGRDAGESVVGEANVAQLRQFIQGRGESSQLVETQVERVELLQKAEFAGEAGQTVVAQVQNLQVLEATDGHGEFLQLQQKQKGCNAMKNDSLHIVHMQIYPDFVTLKM